MGEDQWNHRRHGGIRGQSGQNTESCIGASYWRPWILCWLVEFAAYLMNRFDIGSDGKTPLPRLHGREKILYIAAKPARGGKCEPRLHLGVSGGMLSSLSEAVVVTEQGLAIKTRAANVRRIPESERWDADRILGVRAVFFSSLLFSSRLVSSRHVSLAHVFLSYVSLFFVSSGMLISGAETGGH